MIIGVDCDSVLNNLDEVWAAWIAKERGKPYTVADMTHWNTHETSGMGMRVYDFLEIPGTFRNLQPRAGAVEGMRRLVGDGHEVLVISRVIGLDYMEKLEFLAEHYPFIKPDNFIGCSSKSRILCDVMVDDGIHNLFGVKGRRILFDQPWNQNNEHNDEKLEKAAPFWRAFGWEHLTTVIDQFC